MIRLYLQRIEVVILNTVNHIKRESGKGIFDLRSTIYDNVRKSNIENHKSQNPELFPQL